MGTAAKRRRLARKCNAIALEYAQKRFNKNPKERDNGWWVTSRHKPSSQIKRKKRKNRNRR